MFYSPIVVLRFNIITYIVLSCDKIITFRSRIDSRHSTIRFRNRFFWSEDDFRPEEILLTFVLFRLVTSDRYQFHVTFLPTTYTPSALYRFIARRSNEEIH